MRRRRVAAALAMCTHAPLEQTTGLLATFVLLVLALPGVVQPNDWDSYRGWKVRACNVSGIDRSTGTQIERGLALAATGLLLTQMQVFFPETLAEDVQRTRLFLARRGYPYARVTPEVRPEERREVVKVLLHVDLGPVVTAVAVSIDSMPPALTERARRTLQIEPGDVLVDTNVGKSVAEQMQLLQEHGYARATVATHLEWVDSTHVHLRFRARPGAAYVFGDVQVSGPGSDLVGLARKTMGIERGEPYSPAAMTDARENLRTLGLFQQTKLEIVDVATDTLDVDATLVERRPTSVEASLRYWTDDQLQGMARWTNRNVFGGGRGLSVGGSASTFLQKLETSTWWPALTGPRTMGIVTLRSEREDEDNYTSVTSGSILSLRYNRSFATHALVGIDFSYVQVTEKTVGADSIPVQDGLLTALRFEASRRHTDDPISATRGHTAGAAVEWAPDELGSDNSYVLASTGLALYLPLLPRTQVAVRILAAAGTPTGASQVLLPNKRFYSGGGTSHRGFERHQLGPLDANGTAVGGEAKLETSVELRFPLFWKFRGAVFVDVGQVWPTPDEITASSLEVATGPGFWLQTPIGPLRADWGFRLTDYVPGQPEHVFHFSVGPAF